MRKECIFKYPSLKQGQFDLNRALISMLNCRKYIQSQSFQEVNGNNSNITGIAGGYAEIFFSDGSIVSNDDFQRTSDKDSLLENMISKQVIVIPVRCNNTYNSYGKLGVITNTFKLNEYNVQFAIKDTTKEKLGFFRGIGR